MRQRLPLVCSVNALQQNQPGVLGAAGIFDIKWLYGTERPALALALSDGTVQPVALAAGKGAGVDKQAAVTIAANAMVLSLDVREAGRPGMAASTSAGDLAVLEVLSRSHACPAARRLPVRAFRCPCPETTPPAVRSRPGRAAGRWAGHGRRTTWRPGPARSIGTRCVCVLWTEIQRTAAPPRA